MLFKSVQLVGHLHPMVVVNDSTSFTVEEAERRGIRFRLEPGPSGFHEITPILPEHRCRYWSTLSYQEAVERLAEGREAERHSHLLNLQRGPRI